MPTFEVLTVHKIYVHISISKLTLNITPQQMLLKFCILCFKTAVNVYLDQRGLFLHAVLCLMNVLGYFWGFFVFFFFSVTSLLANELCLSVELLNGNHVSKQFPCLWHESVSPLLGFLCSSKLIQSINDKYAILFFSQRTAIVALVVSGECEISLRLML